ncbi:MAG TPA: TetR/AcrR family transcriptional regulator, partial [Anaerolineae bacterium]|nr:TetR/AcrR family transcriptional regulator [Anaerolineae bacterium]
GCQGFLAACMDPQLQQIVIIDAPAVLGWEMWRQIDSKHGLNDLKQALRDLSEAGLIKPLPLEALAHLLSGAMNEAVLWIAQAERPDQALGEATEALNTLLAALRE